MFTFFSKDPMAAILDFQNCDYFFLKSGNISASNHPRHMILVSKHTFSRSRNPVGQHNLECDTIHTRYSYWGINQTSLLENVFFYNCKDESMWDVNTIKNINNLHFFEFTDVPWVQRYQIIRFIVEQRTLTVTVIIWFAIVVMRVSVIFALCVAKT